MTDDRRCERVEAENAKLEAEVTRLNGLDATQAATIRSLEAENARLHARVTELDDVLRLNLAVHPDDPLVIVPVERRCVMAEAEVARLKNEVATANTEAATWRMKESQAKSHCAVVCAKLRERDAEVTRLREALSVIGRLERCPLCNLLRPHHDDPCPLKEPHYALAPDQPAPECAWIDCPHKAPHKHGGAVTYNPVAAPDARDVGDLSMLKNHDPHEALWFPAERVAELVAALEAAPIRRLDEYLTEFLDRYKAWVRDVRYSALAKWMA